jgi:hypothetical protein
MSTDPGYARLNIAVKIAGVLLRRPHGLSPAAETNVSTGKYSLMTAFWKDGGPAKNQATLAATTFRLNARRKRTRARA